MADPGAYTQVNWQNKAAGGTKLGATNLNKVEDGLAALYNFSAKGSLWVASAAAIVAELAVGSNDQILVADSTADEGIKWANINTLAVALSMFTAKGDIAAATASGAVDNLAVGSDDFAVIADSGETTGLKYGPEAQTYTPTFSATTTPPTLGTGGSTSGRYMRLGDLVFVWISVTFGSSGVDAGSGTYTLSLPVTATTGILHFGTGRWLHDTTDIGVDIILSSSTTVVMRRRALTTGEDLLVQHNSPVTWDADDTFHCFLVVEAA